MTVLSGPRRSHRSQSAGAEARPAAAGGFVTGMLRVSWLAELQAQMLHYPQESMPAAIIRPSACALFSALCGPEPVLASVLQAAS